MLIKNPAPRPGEIHPFESWEEIDAIAAELDVFGRARRLPCRDWCAARGGLRRRVARRRPQAQCLHGAPRVREGADEGLHEDDGLAPSGAATRACNRCARGARPSSRDPVPGAGWRADRHQQLSSPGVDAGARGAGVAHRRIYDLRHTYASWSLAAGVDIFTLARRMGTSVKMIDRTYGHLVAGADVYERELLDAFDEGRSRPLGRYLDAEEGLMLLEALAWFAGCVVCRDLLGWSQPGSNRRPPACKSPVSS